MQNVSELLPMSERVAVLDNLSQKLSNSGYKLEKVRQILVGGLSGYEKRLRQSKLEKSNGYRPLHESAAGSHLARSKKKLTGKNTWYKEKREEMQEVLKDLDGNIQKTRQEIRKDDRKEKSKKLKEKQRRV